MILSSIFIPVLSCLILLGSGFLAKSHAEPSWELRPSLSIAETYNSNIFSSTNETEDFITGVGAILNALYRGTSTDLQANYLATLNAYAHHPELNVVTHDGRISMDMARWFKEFVRVSSLTVSEDFTYTPDLRDYYFDPERGGGEPVGNYGIRTRRTESFRNAASINIRRPVSGSQDLNLRYSNLLTEFSDPAFIDNITHTFSIGTSYRIRRNTLSSDLVIRKSLSDNVDTNSYSITAGLRHMLTPVIQGEISIGWEIMDQETTGNTANARGALRISKTSEFISYHVGYIRESNTANGISASPVVSQMVYINMAGRHTRQLSSNIGASYARNNSVSGGEVDIRSYNLSVGASYAIRKWLTGTLSVSRLIQDSEAVSAQDIERNLIMFQLVTIWNT